VCLYSDWPCSPKNDDVITSYVTCHVISRILFLRDDIYMWRSYALNCEKVLRMAARCIVVGCRKTTKDGVGIRGLPKDSTERRIWTPRWNWAEERGTARLVEVEICSTQFEDDSFHSGLYSQFGKSKLKRLKADTIPTKIRDNPHPMENNKMDRTAGERGHLKIT